MDTMIKAEGLTIGYGKDAIARGINFTVHKGDYLCITGENGSGKTTLMKTILRLTPALGGYLFIMFKDAPGYLPQRADIRPGFPASVEEVICSGLTDGKPAFHNAADKERVLNAAEKTGISDLLKKRFGELSGGQQQKVLLARALCPDPPLLVLDEPVTGLDPESAENMYSLIDSLNKDSVTVIMISHDTASVERYAAHILHMSGGTAVFRKKGDVL